MRVSLHCTVTQGGGYILAVGNYRGRISPLPRSKLNFKCSVAAAWTMLLTSGFAHRLGRFFIISIIIVIISFSFLLKLYLEIEIWLALNGGERREKEECPSLYTLDL